MVAWMGGEVTTAVGRRAADERAQEGEDGCGGGVMDGWSVLVGCRSSQVKAARPSQVLASIRVLGGTPSWRPLLSPSTCPKRWEVKSSNRR